MTGLEQPRILVVDDEEAILETMTFTFMDVYEVLTSDDAQRALELVEEHAPVSVVITDQRMPGMTGVELLKRIYEKHPEVVRIMLTGFADTDATVQAINDGHVYAYINKPWEPEELKQVVKRAVEHYQLTAENRRLMEDLRAAASIMEAVIDRLDVGAIAMDSEGIVRAINKPLCSYLGLDGEQRGLPIDELLAKNGLEGIGSTVTAMSDDGGAAFEDLDVDASGHTHRFRVSGERLNAPDGEILGRVVFFKEISHEPLRRRLDEVVANVMHDGQEGEGLRDRLESGLRELAELESEVRGSSVVSPSMAQLLERLSRSQTAMHNWLDVDDLMAREEYPDAQLLLERMRLATARWPHPDALPARVQELARQVEAYYDSGENPRQRVL